VISDGSASGVPAILSRQLCVSNQREEGNGATPKCGHKELFFSVEAGLSREAGLSDCTRPDVDYPDYVIMSSLGHGQVQSQSAQHRCNTDG
jgi:hypothetical protein